MNITPEIRIQIINTVRDLVEQLSTGEAQIDRIEHQLPQRVSDYEMYECHSMRFRREEGGELVIHVNALARSEYYENLAYDLLQKLGITHPSHKDDTPKYREIRRIVERRRVEQRFRKEAADRIQSTQKYWDELDRDRKMNT